MNTKHIGSTCTGWNPEEPVPVSTSRAAIVNTHFQHLQPSRAVTASHGQRTLFPASYSGRASRSVLTHPAHPTTCGSSYSPPSRSRSRSRSPSEEEEGAATWAWSLQPARRARPANRPSFSERVGPGRVCVCVRSRSRTRNHTFSERIARPAGRHEQNRPRAGASLSAAWEGEGEGARNGRGGGKRQRVVLRAVVASPALQPYATDRWIQCNAGGTRRDGFPIEIVIDVRARWNETVPG